jgi:hypothetical protein
LEAEQDARIRLLHEIQRLREERRATLQHRLRSLTRRRP